MVVKTNIYENIDVRSINFKIGLYTKVVSIYTVASIIILMMCAYLIYSLYRIYNNWVKRKRRMKGYVTEKIKQSAHSLRNLSTGFADSNNDDELYDNTKPQSGKDEYYKFDENINSIILSYKAASKECNKGDKVKNGDVSSIKNKDPDRAFIDSSYDNY